MQHGAIDLPSRIVRFLRNLFVILYISRINLWAIYQASKSSNVFIVFFNILNYRLRITGYRLRLLKLPITSYRLRKLIFI